MKGVQPCWVCGETCTTEELAPGVTNFECGNDHPEWAVELAKEVGRLKEGNETMANEYMLQSEECQKLHDELSAIKSAYEDLRAREGEGGGGE